MLTPIEVICDSNSKYFADETFSETCIVYMSSNFTECAVEKHGKIKYWGGGAKRPVEDIWHHPKCLTKCMIPSCSIAYLILTPTPICQLKTIWPHLNVPGPHLVLNDSALKSANQPASQSVGQPISRLANQLASQSVIHPVSQPVSQPANMSVSKTCSQSASQYVSKSVI